jgi:CheY-like chemotaxis protein
VVEDDELVRAHVESLLKSLGYDVLAAGSGPEALQVLRQDRKIDLLFTDLVMPGGMNGPQLAKEARRLRPTLKILYTSGHAAGTPAQETAPAPGIDLLSKPYQRRELAARLRRVLEARSTDS